MRKLFIFVLFLVSHLLVLSQTINPETIEYRYWIYFKDKGEFKPGDNIIPGSEAYILAKSGLTEKAIWRRSKVLSPENLVSYADLPVYKGYIESINKLGANPHSVSKWLNAVSVMTVKGRLDEIKKLPFVEKIEGVHYLEFTGTILPVNSKPVIPVVPDEINKYDYGISYWQNRQINVPALHNYGITGFGVRVGMCDNGFNWRTHQALRTRRVLGEYDWIFKDDSTQNQKAPYQVPTDPFDQDDHGTATMSNLGGFYPGQLIGPAFDVEFYLSKTEYDAAETPVEEDYWVEAVEWMEAKGVEVISCSLIYKPFDPPNNDYTYKDMDGKTTIIVRAATIAANLGIVVVNSMGNEYQTDPPSIVSPPDGDKVISVGAVDSAGNIAYFSSNGPTSDGRIKPDIVAMGVGNYTAVSMSGTLEDSGYTYSNGTSFSCPITAGVCALILSVHPELTPDQVKEALHMTADKKDEPGNVFGWGLVNAYDAALYFGMIMSNKPEIKETDGQTTFSIYVLSKDIIDVNSVKMYYSVEGSGMKEAQMELSGKIGENNSGNYSITLPVSISKAPMTFYFSAKDSKFEKIVPYKAPEKFFYFNLETKTIEIF